MSSATEVRDEPGFFESIRGKMTLANLASVLVLLIVGAVATIQFRELARLLNEVSDGTEVLMRLSHAYDEREQLVSSFSKGYGAGAASGADARVRFAAVAEDLSGHARVAREKSRDGKTATLLTQAETGILSALRRAGTLDRLAAEQRE